MKWDDMAVVGRVARAHGIRGQVIVNLETDFPEERFRPGAELYIDRNGAMERLTVTTVRFHRERPIIGLTSIDDMNAASRLAGAELRIPMDRLAALPAGTFYRHDLIGCRIERPTGEHIGVVTAVEGTMGGSRLVVDSANGELLVPLAEEICIAIDPGAKLIVVDPPEGLLDLNKRN